MMEDAERALLRATVEDAIAARGTDPCQQMPERDHVAIARVGQDAIQRHRGCGA